MSANEIVKVEANRLPAAQLSFADMRLLATDVANSGLFSCRTPEAALTLMMLAQAENLHPIQAMRQFHIIEGKPSMRSDAMQARFMQAGGKIKWLERSDERCSAEFSHPLTGSLTVTWTLEDARRAGLANKDVWKKYPRALLTARVVSEGVRVMDPGVVCGLYTPEEVQDFDTPLAPPPPNPRPKRATKPEIVTGTIEEPAAAEPAKPAEPLATPEQIKEMRDLMMVVHIPEETINKWFAKAKALTWEQMPASVMVKCLEYVQAKADEQVEKEGKTVQDGAEDSSPASNASEESQEEEKGEEKPDLSTWDNFLAAGAKAAQLQGLEDMLVFAEGIKKAVLRIGKKGKEDSISVVKKTEWYEAILVGAFDYATGKINQVEQALRS